MNQMTDVNDEVLDEPIVECKHEFRLLQAMEMLESIIAVQDKLIDELNSLILDQYVQVSRVETVFGYKKDIAILKDKLECLKKQNE